MRDVGRMRAVFLDCGAELRYKSMGFPGIGMMRRTGVSALLLVALAAAIPAAASDAEEFERLWKHYKPVMVSDTDDFVRNRSTYFGETFEFTATTVGQMARNSEKVLMVRPGECSPIQVTVKHFSAVMSPGRQVRLIVRVPADPGDQIVFELLAITHEENAAALRPASGRVVVGTNAGGAPRPFPSRGGSAAVGAYTDQEVMAAYARAALAFNPRLTAAQAAEIAAMIINYSRLWGVDARLIMAVVAAESSFKPLATSRAGAMGLGQLMPATARSLGVQNAYDPAQNLGGCVRLIRGHLERSEGDLAIALAKYNAGPGAVRRYGGVPPYRETINYIARVTSLFLQMAPEYAGLLR